MALPDDNISTSSVTAPAAFAETITPADVDLTTRSRGIYIGGTGDLVVVMAGAKNTVTFEGVVAGTILPIRVNQIKVATTATGIVILY